MLVRALCRNADISGTGRNTYQNTMHFNCPSVQDLAQNADALMATGMIPQFYSDLGPHMSAVLDNVLEVRFYDLADPEPRVPEIRTQAMIYGDAAKNNMFEELCVVLTLLPAPPITRTRRGRLYLGPWNSDVLVYQNDDDHPTVSALVQTSITGAATNLMNAVASSGRQWVVRSEKLGTFTAIVGGYVDEAPDIQRRRGIDAGTRVFWGGAGGLRTQRKVEELLDAQTTLSDHLCPDPAAHAGAV